MKFFLPHYHPGRTIVHRVHPAVKFVYVLLVLFACWYGVYRLTLLPGYVLLLLAFGISSAALVIATNARSLLRLLTAPLWIGSIFLIVAVLMTFLDARDHIRGVSDHLLTATTLRDHLWVKFLEGFRRVVTLFVASTTAWIMVVTVSASDLRRLRRPGWRGGQRRRLLPFSLVLYIELFFSFFSRFQESATRVVYAHRQNAVGHRRVEYFKIKGNPLWSVWAGLVVFIVTVAAQVPSIWNLREMRRRLLTGEE